MAGVVRKGLKNILMKNPDDVVILSSLRTPITRANKGHFKDAYPEELLAAVLKATLAANPNLDPAKIQDVGIGVVLSELGGSKAGRMAMNHVGYPSSTSFYTVNRACSSGLSAITNVAHSIATGMIDVGVGGGMESMTRNYGSRAIPTVLLPELKSSPVKDARDCIMPMGLTSENVAERYNVSRADQDAFAAQSHQKAHKAQQAGLFDKEIVPVTTRFQEVDKQGNKVSEEQIITVTKDDGIRPNASLEGHAEAQARIQGKRHEHSRKLLTSLRRRSRHSPHAPQHGDRTRPLVIPSSGNGQGHKSPGVRLTRWALGPLLRSQSS